MLIQIQDYLSLDSSEAIASPVFWYSLTVTFILFITWWFLRLGKPELVSVFSDEEGAVQITPQALRELVRKSCSSIPGVHSPSTKIYKKSKLIRLLVRLRVEPDCKVKEVRSQLREKLEHVMIENLNLTKGLIFSQEVMLELTKSGLSREQSYKMVQNYAKKCFAENLDLFDVISSDKLIMSKITPKKLKSIFSYAKHFKNVNFIFRRVFK